MMIPHSFTMEIVPLQPLVADVQHPLTINIGIAFAELGSTAHEQAARTVERALADDPRIQRVELTLARSPASFAMQFHLVTTLGGDPAQQIEAADHLLIELFATIWHELHAPVAAGALSSAPDHAATPVERLTARERDVLQLLAKGYSNLEIAQRLTIAVNTVKMHVRSIYGKLCVRSRVQAVEKARKLMLVM